MRRFVLAKAASVAGILAWSFLNVSESFVSSFMGNESLRVRPTLINEEVAFAESPDSPLGQNAQVEKTGKHSRSGHDNLSDKDKDAGKGEGDKGKAEKDTEPDEIDPGVIAASGNSYGRSLSVDANLNTGVTDQKVSPIMASVNYANGRCSSIVTNASKKNSYSLSYVVEGFDGDSKNFSKSYVLALGPGKSSSHDLSCKEGLSLKVTLRKGTKKK